MGETRGIRGRKDLHGGVALTTATRSSERMMQDGYARYEVMLHDGGRVYAGIAYQRRCDMQELDDDRWAAAVSTGS